MLLIIVAVIPEKTMILGAFGSCHSGVFYPPNQTSFSEKAHVHQYRYFIKDQIKGKRVQKGHSNPRALLILSISMRIVTCSRALTALTANSSRLWGPRHND